MPGKKSGRQGDAPRSSAPQENASGAGDGGTDAKGGVAQMGSLSPRHRSLAIRTTAGAPSASRGAKRLRGQGCCGGQRWGLGLLLLSLLALSMLFKLYALHSPRFGDHQDSGLHFDDENEELASDGIDSTTGGARRAAQEDGRSSEERGEGKKGGGMEGTLEATLARRRGVEGGKAAVLEAAEKGANRDSNAGDDGVEGAGISEGSSGGGSLDEGNKSEGQKMGAEGTPKGGRVRSFNERAKKSIIKIGEDDACALPRPLKPCRLPPRQRIHVVFVSALWNREAYTQVETENILKTILYGTLCPLHIHYVVAGEPEVSLLHAMMRSINAAHMAPAPSPFVQGSAWGVAEGAAPRQGSATASSGVLGAPSEKPKYFNDTEAKGLDGTLLYSMHYIPIEWVVERAKALYLYPLNHHAGIAGISKFFLPELLWQVDRAIYLDVDMLLAGDVQDLYGYFRTMERSKKLLYYMSNNHPEGNGPRRWHQPYCSCHLVLHLDRMRAANMSKLFLKTLRGHKPRQLAKYTADGEQFMFLRVCQMRGRCRILPRMWNVSGCSKPIPFLGLNSKGKEANGTCWRFVHFNCMAHTHKGTGAFEMPYEWQDAHAWVSGLTLSSALSHKRS